MHEIVIHNSKQESIYWYNDTGEKNFQQKVHQIGSQILNEYSFQEKTIFLYSDMIVVLFLLSMKMNYDESNYKICLNECA